MTDLSEYLGHILCEVTRARVMGDREALRVAQAYVDDESKLMRTFPVPRMRLPILEIVVPLQVEEVPEGYVERTSTDARSLARLLAAELAPALKRGRLRISTADLTRIIEEDPLLARGRLYEGVGGALSERVNQEVQGRAKKAAPPKDGAKPSAEVFKEVSTAIRERIAKVLASLPRRPAGISVEPRTAVLREVGDPALLLNCKVTIHESALEIHLEEEDGGGEAPRKGEEGAPPPPPRIKRLVAE